MFCVYARLSKQTYFHSYCVVWCLAVRSASKATEWTLESGGSISAPSYLFMDRFVQGGAWRSPVYLSSRKG